MGALCDTTAAVFQGRPVNEKSLSEVPEVARRHDALASTAGLNAEVFDALVVLAAAAFTTAAIADGFAKVQAPAG